MFEPHKKGSMEFWSDSDPHDPCLNGIFEWNLYNGTTTMRSPPMRNFDWHEMNDRYVDTFFDILDYAAKKTGQRVWTVFHDESKNESCGAFKRWEHKQKYKFTSLPTGAYIRPIIEEVIRDWEKGFGQGVAVCLMNPDSTYQGSITFNFQMQAP